MSEIINNIIDTARERLKNPFIGAFILSWIAFNWKALSYFILSDENIGNRMETIETDYVNWYSGFWFPVGFAIFYLLILPILMLLFDLGSRWVLEKRKDHQKTLKVNEYGRLQDLAEEEFTLEEKRAGKQSLKILNDKIEFINKQVVKKDELIESLNLKIKGLTSENELLSNKILNLELVTKEFKERESKLVTMNLNKERESKLVTMNLNNVEDTLVSYDDLLQWDNEWQNIYDNKDFKNLFVKVLGFVRKKQVDFSNQENKIINNFLDRKLIKSSEINSGRSSILFTTKGIYILGKVLKEEN